MDFDVEILNFLTRTIKVTTNNGKTFSTIIKNRNFEDETKAVVSHTVFKLVYNLDMKEVVKEKMEEKGIEYIKKNCRPRSLNVKSVLTEEQREKKIQKVI